MSQRIRNSKSLKFNNCYEDFKKRFLGDIKPVRNLIPSQTKILNEALKLYKHYPFALEHSIKVADDVKYVTKNLGYDDNFVSFIYIASLLHDFGKRYIFDDILHLQGPDELRVAWDQTHDDKYDPNIPIRTQILLEDIIEYNAKNSDNYSNYISNFDKWYNENKIPKKFLKLPVMEYLKEHQQFTRSILEDLGVDEQIVLYASSHHLYLFDEHQRSKLPKECKIIEICDKYNAIAQTEGFRSYARKKSKLESILVIVNEIIGEHNIEKQNFFKSNLLQEDIILTLTKKYFFTEVDLELLPLITDILIRNKGKSNQEDISKCTYMIQSTLEIIQLLEQSNLIDSDNKKKFKETKAHISDSLEKINTNYIRN